MYLDRELFPALERALGHFPAVLITGPRQSGKTTFLRHQLKDGGHYVTFDDPLSRDYARDDPNGFLDGLGDGRVVLDEIQYAPELFPYLKIRIDADRRRYGRFVMTGSQQFALMANISESLAGRIAILELLPFSVRESDAAAERELADILWQGTYPEPALEPAKRDLWLSSYVQTYVERDVRQLHNIQSLRTFETFLALAAARHGQALVFARLASTLGISQPTAKTWISVLEAGYLVHTLRPYFENFGKRVAKTPKLYFLDPALVASMTRQPSAAAALGGAMGGVLFEGLVVGEAIKAFTNRGLRPDLYYWRAHDGLEVDLLIRLGDRLQGIEIKLTATPTPRHLEPLDRFRSLAGDAAAEGGLLVCRVAEPTPMPGGNLALPWRRLPAWLDQALDG